VRGEPVYTTLGVSEVKTEIRIMVDGRWKTKQELGADAERVWGDNRLDLSSLEKAEHVEITFTATAVADKYESAYSLARISDDVDFVIRGRSTGSRYRKAWVGGKTEYKKTTAKGAKHHLIGTKTVTLALEEFAGEIELQPLFVASKALHDRKKSSVDQKIELMRGGILGWGDPTVVVLERARNGMNSMFEFKWTSFSTPSVEGLREDEFFAIKWGARPVIWLNQDVENLENVLTSTANQGVVARTRDALNLTISLQALSVAISSCAQIARKLSSENPDWSADEVMDGLNPEEKMVLRSWIHVLDADSNGAKTPAIESLERIISKSDYEMKICLIESMPQNLQVAFNSKSASENLLSLIDKGNSDGK
jgi:hypothetical protein